MVEVKGSQYVDVVVNRINGKLAVNLVNTAGAHFSPDIYTYDEIPPLGPLAVTIRAEKRPKRVTWQPDGAELDFTFGKGEIRLTLNRLDIHGVILVE